MQTYLDFAIEMAHGARVIALQHFRSDISVLRKADKSPVTDADIKINNLLIERVKVAFPDHAVRGEEASMENVDARYVWVCDPIDGTIPFACGIPTFAFSLALVDRTDGQPVVAVAYDVASDRLYSAVRGGGTTCNTVPVRVSTTANLSGAYVDVEARAFENLYSNINTIRALQEENVFCYKMQSVVYGGAQVANGTCVGVIFFNPYAHDVAALKLIVEEAGGKVTDLEGNERRYDEDGRGAVVSNGILHEALLACVK